MDELQQIFRDSVVELQAKALELLAGRDRRSRFDSAFVMLTAAADERGIVT